jgi:hypothetical protein
VNQITLTIHTQIKLCMSRQYKYIFHCFVCVNLESISFSISIFTLNCFLYEEIVNDNPVLEGYRLWVNS